MCSLVCDSRTFTQQCSSPFSGWSAGASVGGVLGPGGLRCALSLPWQHCSLSHAPGTQHTHPHWLCSCCNGESSWALKPATRGTSPTDGVTNNNSRSPAGRGIHCSHTLGHPSKPGSQQALSAAHICCVWEIRAQLLHAVLPMWKNTASIPEHGKPTARLQCSRNTSEVCVSRRDSDKLDNI